MTDFQSYLSKGILTNQLLLGQQKLDENIFPMLPIMAYFPFLDFVMTDTKLFNKSIPGKRLSCKHVLLILTEA